MRGMPSSHWRTPLVVLVCSGLILTLLGRPPIPVEPDALAALCDYDYPGNIRELENLIERGLTLESSERLTKSSLPPLQPRRASAIPAHAAAGAHGDGDGLTIPDGGLDLPAGPLTVCTMTAVGLCAFLATRPRAA